MIAPIEIAKKDDFVRHLGAPSAVNYKEEDLRTWAERQGSVDYVSDCVGGETLADAWFAVKDGGNLISVVEPPEGERPEPLTEKDVKNVFFIMKPDGKQLAKILNLLDQGLCKPVADCVWDLEDYRKAFERLNSSHANCKVLIELSGVSLVTSIGILYRVWS